MKDAYRPYDILNTEFKNISQDITITLADINIGGPDELDPEDIPIEGPLLP